MARTVVVVLAALLLSACATPAREAEAPTGLTGDAAAASEDAQEQEAQIAQLGRLLDVDRAPTLGEVAWLLDLSTVKRPEQQQTHVRYTAVPRTNAIGVEDVRFAAVGDAVNPASRLRAIELRLHARHGDRAAVCLDIRTLSQRLRLSLQPPEPTSTPGLRWSTSALGTSPRGSVRLSADDRRYPCVTRIAAHWFDPA